MNAIIDRSRFTEDSTLFDDGDHRWVWLGADAEAMESVPANQYLIQNGDEACLLDPGSVLDFSRTIANLSRHTSPDKVRWLFFSHQDPDVSSAMPMWAAITPARIVLADVWSRFMPHYGELEMARMQMVPDEGGTFRLGDTELQVVPAHFLHSVGNITLYDPRARILFTADIGAAILPPDYDSLYVRDFDEHVRYMEGFHRRYMTSRRACADYAERVSRLQVDMIVPQHGAIFRGDDVRRFLRWFSQLECGVDLIGRGGRHG